MGIKLRTIFLVTIFGDPDKERLIRANTRSKAIQHVIGVNKATSEDVERVLSQGGKTEEAVE